MALLPSSPLAVDEEGVVNVPSPTVNALGWRMRRYLANYTAT